MRKFIFIAVTLIAAVALTGCGQGELEKFQVEYDALLRENAAILQNINEIENMTLSNETDKKEWHNAINKLSDKIDRYSYDVENFHATLDTAAAEPSEVCATAACERQLWSFAESARRELFAKNIRVMDEYMSTITTVILFEFLEQNYGAASISSSPD